MEQITKELVVVRTSDIDRNMLLIHLCIVLLVLIPAKSDDKCNLYVPPGYDVSVSPEPMTNVNLQYQLVNIDTIDVQDYVSFVTRWYIDKIIYNFVFNSR